MQLLEQYKRGDISYEHFQDRLWGGNPEKLRDEMGEAQFQYYLYARPGEFYENNKTDLRVKLAAASPETRLEMQKFLLLIIPHDSCQEAIPML